VYRLTPDSATYHIRKDAMFFTLECEGDTLALHVPARYETLARLIIAEEMLTLRSMLHLAQESANLDTMEHDLVADLFAGGHPDETP